MNHLPAAETQLAAMVTDASLVTAALAGDRRAFGELARRYERAVRAICLAVLRDEHLACDAAREAFVAAFRRLRRLRNAEAFGPWLLTIGRNEALHLLRKRRPASPLPPLLAVPESHPADHDALLAAVANLPDEERLVVTMQFFGRHGVAEIAAMMGSPIGTVTKQLSRAYERLRKKLEVRP
jgi:RNA polymerase sigma-70 factor (ECF subfamily)